MVTLVSTSVAAVVKLIRIFSPLVIAPLFQLLASLHLMLPLPPPPVQVSVVVTSGVAARAKTRSPSTRDSDGCKSFRFVPAEACAGARRSRLTRAPSKQRTIDSVTTREDDGR